MTVYGLDVSHYQSPGLDLDADNLKRQGYQFVMVKATEGSDYRDPAYHAYRTEAQKEGMLFAAYHFLKHGDIAKQVDNFVGFVTDKSIPIMLDVESNGATVADANQFRAEMEKRGRRVTLLYLPHWYWTTLGSPSLKGWTVVSSSYPSSAHKVGSALYPGDNGAGWAAYGGVSPTIWQFASSGEVSGYAGNVDLDAFKGTLDGLIGKNLFKNYGPKPKKKPDTLVAYVQRNYKNNGHKRFRLIALDKAVKNGRTGIVKDVRDEIVRLVNSLPDDPDNSYVHQVKDYFQKYRVIKMGRLNQAVNRGRKGKVRQIRDEIVKQINRLPAR